MGSDKSPRVSIICLAYNHEAFIEAAITSIVEQSYTNIEVVMVDDASTDGSAEIMQNFSDKYGWPLIANKTNLGNCRSFNKGFEVSAGDYIIDLAADDVLMPKRVETGLEAFQKVDQSYGVHYSDVLLIDQKDNSLSRHNEQVRKHLGKDFIFPEGQLYTEVLDKYFISAPSMMMKRAVIEDLGGYDEELSYEDFDFWVRSARQWKYCYTDEVLVQKRVLSGSLSSRQFGFRSRHDRSTFKVCQKAMAMNQNKAEWEALKRRIVYEQKHALAHGNLKLAKDYQQLKKKCADHIRQLV